MKIWSACLQSTVMQHYCFGLRGSIVEGVGCFMLFQVILPQHSASKVVPDFVNIWHFLVLLSLTATSHMHMLSITNVRIVCVCKMACFCLPNLFMHSLNSLQWSWWCGCYPNNVREMHCCIPGLLPSNMQGQQEGKGTDNKDETTG